MELGVNAKGVYGSQIINKPASFHDSRDIYGNGLFGFIANPQADNWIDYDGDYFIPGEMEEGFAIQINGISYNNNNNTVDNRNDILGGIVNHEINSTDCFEDIAKITWEGTINGLNITRIYSVTENGLYIQMNTVIENVSLTEKRNVYWMHNVDPDNNQSLNGILNNNHETDMELIAQASSPVDNISLVTASQDPIGIPEDMDGSKISFYSRDERARVTYGGFQNRMPFNIWNGIGFFNNEGDTANRIDEAISIAFNLGDLSPGDSTSFIYYYILEEVDENFVPYTISASTKDTSTCGGNEGQIKINGLQANQVYAITYLDDGVLISNVDYTSDAMGNIVINNLNAGTYSNITIGLNLCETYIDGDFTISDPVIPNFLVSKIDSTLCTTNNGIIEISNLIPNQVYTVKYTKLGDTETVQTYTSNASGVISILNLDAGTYSGFIAEVYNCSVVNNDSITILAPNNPIANPIPDQLYCDDNDDAIIEINDLSSLNNFVLGAQNPLDFDITYHLTLEDATDNIELNFPYISTGDENFLLYARITNTTTGCFSSISFNNIIILPPVFNLNDDFICLDANGNPNPNFSFPVLQTSLSESEYDFQWFKDGVLINSSNTSSLTVNEIGTYSVIVTHKASLCTSTNDAVISYSATPQTLDVTVVTEPFSNNPTVEIVAIGLGNYEYKVDDGPYQESPIFQNLSAGYHTFFINDINGCGEVSVERFIINYPKFFTPNNDGFNDTWQIVGIKTLVNPEIFIYDRYGKLLKQLNPLDNGWDGTYNGRIMPSNDYWFKILFDYGSTQTRREFTNHFTLKR